MSKIAIVTDSNSGITQKEAEALGIHVLAMPFMIDGKLYYEERDLSQDAFYEKMIAGAEITTSQPSPEEVMELWDKLLLTHDQIVYIPMSSGLSGSCQTARLLAEDYDGRVAVVDNQRISVTQKRSAMDAYELAQRGEMDAEQIRQYLENDKFNSSIYIMLDTLTYLKKGGRITPAAAMLGNILRLKPVLQIQGEKLDAFAKARSEKLGRGIMLDAIRRDIDERFGGAGNVRVFVAHTDNYEAAHDFSAAVSEALGCEVAHCDPLSLSVSCHIGPGALAVACSKKIDEYL